MVTKSAKSEKLQTEFALLANSGCDASTQLEQGQAETPISDGFRSLASRTANPPLVISMLGFDDSTVAMVQNWLATASHVSIISASVDKLRQQPNSYQQFCTSGHILMVAGKSSHRMTETEAVLLSNLSSNFTVVWPIVLGEQQTDRDVWWQQAVLSAPTGRLDALYLQTTPSGIGGEVLANPACPLRNALIFERQVHLLQKIFGNLANRQKREIQALQVRQKFFEKKPKESPIRSYSASDKDVARVREQFAEELAQLEKQIFLKSDRSIQPLGKLTNLMRENATRLRIEDLDKEESPVILKLSVNGSHLATVNRKVEHALRQELSADVGTIQDRLQHLTAQASISLSDFLGDQVLSAPPLQESSIWRTVENLLAVGKESHIELPRKGFFDVLTAGRQKVFILIMFVSLMGRMGLPNLFQTGMMRTCFGLFMLSVLVGSMVSAIFTWRRERESQSEKEMFKIKESLFNDGTKVIEQVEKGKLNFLRDYLKEVNKKFDQQLKRVAEQQISGKSSDTDIESQRREVNRKQLEARSKHLTELGRQISKLTADAQKLHVNAIGVTREAAREHVTVLPCEEPSFAPLTAVEPAKPESTPLLPTDNMPTQPEPEAIASPAPESSSPVVEPTMPARTPRVSALAQRREQRQKAREAVT